MNTAGLWEVAVQDVHPQHGHGAAPGDEQSAVHTISHGYYQPYTDVVCIKDMIEGNNDQRPVDFPVIAAIRYYPIPDNLKNISKLIDGVPVIEYPSLERAHVFNQSGSNSSYRLAWVDLPDSLLSTPALGAVIQLPTQHSTPPNSSVRSMVVCTLAAGWGSSSMNTTTLRASTSATSSLINADLIFGQGTHPPKSAPNDPLVNRYQEEVDESLFFFEPLYPSTPIKVRADWAEFLNPVIPSLNATVADNMFKVVYGNQSSSAPEILSRKLLSALLANGLARIGYDNVLQGTPKLTSDGDGTPKLDGNFWIYSKGDFFTVDAHESANWPRFRVDSRIEGYAYNTSGTPPKVAIAFLLTYCLLALSYTLYSSITGKSILSICFYSC